MFSRLRIIVRIFLICVTMAIPIALLCWFFVGESRKMIVRTQSEIGGMEHVQAVWATIELLLPNSQANLNSKVTPETKAAAARLAELSGVYDEQHGTTKLSKTFLSAVDIGRPAEKIATGMQLIDGIANGSQLVLDADANSYYAIGVTTSGLPTLARAAFNIRENFISTAKSKGMISPQQRLDIVKSYAEYENALKVLPDQIEHVFEGQGDDVRARITEKLKALQAPAKAFLDLVGPRTQKLMQGKFPEDLEVGVVDSETAMRAALSDLWKTVAADANVLLEQRLEKLENGLTLNLSIAAVFILASLGLSALVTRSIATQLGGLTGVLKEIERGHLDAEVPYTQLHTEIGAMARSFLVFRDTLADAERLREEREHGAEEHLAAAARREELVRRFTSDMSALAAAFSRSSDQVNAAAGDLAANAEQTADRTGNVELAAKAAAENVNTVASATEELAASIGEISSQVRQSAEIAATAADDATASEANIAALKSAAEKIGDVVSLISAIAEQTNLLALNATIEAARAGDAGKGFAVVASEVKQLASQTAKATAEISAKIVEIQNSTSSSVATIARIVATVRRLEEITGSIAASVEQQGAATKEIADNCQRAASGAGAVSTNIVDVGTAADRTGEQAKDLIGLGRDLADRARDLDRQVGVFVAEVAAA